MKKIARNDWKRHSAPHELTFDFTEHANSINEGYAQSSDASKETSERQTSTVGRERKKTPPLKITCNSIVRDVELSSDQYTPGVLKVFGETILPGVQYKSVLASCRSTAVELVKQALERFGLPVQSFKKFVLCDVVGRYEGNENRSDNTTTGKWGRIYARILSDKDKPLLLQKFWKPLDGCSRRYELHQRAHLIDQTETDDTSGLNTNARKILISKLRPGAIPLYDREKSAIDGDGFNMHYSDSIRSDLSSGVSETDDTSVESGKESCHCKSKSCAKEAKRMVPLKNPFFLNIRGYDLTRDNVIYPVKYKKFIFGNPTVRNHILCDDVPKIPLFAPDIEGTHCNFKVYKFKRTNGIQNAEINRYNYFLEMEPLGNNVRVNGHRISGKTIVKSGDILNIGIYYVFVFKDCSKNTDIPLALPWLPISELNTDKCTLDENSDLRLRLYGDDENKSSTDESMEVSIPEKMSFVYKPDKEEELVKFICAIIQQENTQQTYPLTVSYLFCMCIEHACHNFDRRQLKHLFLRILFTIREKVAEAAKSLSANKFSCTLLESTGQDEVKDQKLERLLLWISNCVQMLLFLKHTFQLPELSSPEIVSMRRCSINSPRNEHTAKMPSPRKEDSAKHAHAQLVTGLEEIVMFCFQQSVYTITKALHPSLSALLDSNPFSDVNSEQCSMEDVTRMYGALAEVTHSVMLHEGITRQLFTYLFFFTSTNVFNKLIADESSSQYYNWSSGVRIRANLSQLEDWATQNGLEDEFGQMFERLLAVSELLATSKNTLIKYQWAMMKDHYQPLTAAQIHHVLKHYQLGTRDVPPAWSPSQEELIIMNNEDALKLSLCNHPPFALPDNCSIIDLIRAPDDPSFWNELRRLRTLYGIPEDDSDSGFSRSNTPRCTDLSPSEEVKEPICEERHPIVKDAVKQEHVSNLCNPSFTEQGETYTEGPIQLGFESQKSRIPVRKSITNPWALRLPAAGSGVCNCATLPRSVAQCKGCKHSGAHCDLKQHTSEQTLMSDLMLEENRENLELGDRYKAPKEKILVNLQKKTNIVDNGPTNRVCKSENKTGNRLNSLKSNVSNCSARNVKPYIRERSNTVGNEKDIRAALKDKAGVQSISMDDVNLPFMYGKPILSASFYEAIERGYESDRRPNRHKSSSTNHLESINERLQRPSVVLHANNIADSSVNSSQTLNRQNTRDSILSDDVFIEESLDNFYRKNRKNKISDNFNVLPDKNTFKPISTSSKSNQSNSCSSQKLMAISFDAGSYSSSIELARNTLYVTGVNEGSGSTVINTRDSGEQNKTLPDRMLVEVDEAALASRKRHGSSINVVPSSPRPFVKQEFSLPNNDSNEERKMSPCPLFTVYLKKMDKGLGLGLIDGLHTPLKLAGIYIKKILPNSPADLNGCLQVGDRILAVNGVSVIGASYQSTMDLIRASDDSLTLLVARGNESMARKISSSTV